jgi:hypothetical protein
MSPQRGNGGDAAPEERLTRGAMISSQYALPARPARGYPNAQDENTMSEVPARMKRNLHIVLPVALYLLLRLPSLIEPQWYSDEAGYASTAWLTHAGYGLYVNAWNNKPPLLFRIYGLSQALFGSSEAGLHALTILSGLAAIIAAPWGMSRLFTKRTALWGGLVIAVIIGSPMLDGNLALPESLLIGPVTVAMVWFLCSCTAGARQPRTLTLVVIGGLFACGFLIQQTAIADFASVMLWCLVRRNWRSTLLVGGTFAITVAAVIVPFMISSGAHNVWFALVASYADYVNDALGDRLPAYLVRIAILVAMAVVAWFFRNAKDARLELVRIWCTALLFTAIAAGYAYEHFLLPVMIPLVMLVTGLLSRQRGRLSHGIRRPRVLVAGALLVAIASTGWSLFMAGYRTTVWSVGYYANALSYVSGSISEFDYDTYFGGTLNYGEREAEQWISSHNLAGATAMLWTNLAWPLVDDDLLPPTRSGPLYVTLALEKGTGGILARMNATPPELILITPIGIENLSDIRGFISTHNYEQVIDANGIELYVRSGGSG